MVKVQLRTDDAQVNFEGKILDLPESPLIGDIIFFKNLFNDEELDIAEYEAGKQSLKLEGKVVERMWYLNTESLDFILLCKLELTEL